MKQKNKKVDFLDNLLEDLLAGKRVIRAAQGAIREEQYF